MRKCSRFAGRGRALEHRGNTSRLRDARLARHEPGYGPDTRKDDERHDRDEDAHRGREHTRAFAAGPGPYVVLKDGRMEAVDQVHLNFNPATLTVLNILIGLIMFGVALDIRVDDFKRVVRDPRGPLIGLGAQFLLLPARIRRPMKIFSLTAFGLFIVGALVGNWQHFLQNVGYVAFAVALHNALGLALGYWSGRGVGCHRYDARAISIEVGIQNSALALVLIFGFFDGRGGMAIIAAWWGVWHLISGLTLATYWSRRPVPIPETT